MTSEINIIKAVEDQDSELGDCHNFGRKVLFRAGEILKPRSLYCEYKVYAEESEFRSFLMSVSEGMLELLPILSFEEGHSDLSLRFRGNSYLKVIPLSSPLSDKQIESIGAILALMSYLGVGDLHRENILFGQSEQGIVFAPIDLEVFLWGHYAGNLGVHSQNKRHLDCCAGVAHLRGYLKSFRDENFVAKLLFGYLKFSEILRDNSHELSARFLSAEGGRGVARVLLRNTEEYAEALRHRIFDEFSYQERLQLERNDIPYFFRFIENPVKVYSWRTETEYSEVKNAPLGVSYSTAPSVLSRKDLVVSFLLTIGRDLDIKERMGTFCYQDIQVMLGAHSPSVFFSDNQDRFTFRLSFLSSSFPVSVIKNDMTLHCHPLLYPHQCLLFAQELSQKKLEVRYYPFEEKRISMIPLENRFGFINILSYLLGSNSWDKEIREIQHVEEKIMDFQSQYFAMFSEGDQLGMNDVESAVIDLLKLILPTFRKIRDENKNLAIALFIPLLFKTLAMFSFAPIRELSEFYREQVRAKAVKNVLASIQAYKKMNAGQWGNDLVSLEKISKEAHAKFTTV